jgi:hypothetical protein
MCEKAGIVLKRRMIAHMRLVITCIVLMFLGGCARYEFDIVQPPDLAAHVGTRTATAFDWPPLHYDLQAAEGRLVMHIANTTDEPVELLGAQSFVVDPGNESHPIPSRAMGPKSFIVLVFPPLRPMYPAGPPYGYVVVGPGYYSRAYYYDWAWPYPAAVVAGPPELYWHWRGQTSARVHLTFRRGNETFAQEFVFARKKM